MMRALLLLISLAPPHTSEEGPGRSGADSARVATLLSALAHTDPVICDLIGDQLGNFWMGGEPGRLGRFADAPNVQGAKDSLAGTISDPRAVALLVATLGTDNPCVRRVAAKLLGRSTVSAAVLRGLFDNPTPRIRESAAFAAGVGALSDRNDAVRRAAVRALADLHERSAVAPLEGLLLNDSDPEVRRESASALGNLSAARSLDPLARALGDADVEVQRSAADAIGELDDVTKAPAALVRATTSPDLDLRRQATTSLDKIGDLATELARADSQDDECNT